MGIPTHAVSDDDEAKVLRVVRAIDGELVAYDVDVPRRGLVSIMRIENLKPGDIMETELRSAEVTT